MTWVKRTNLLASACIVGLPPRASDQAPGRFSWRGYQEMSVLAWLGHSTRGYSADASGRNACSRPTCELECSRAIRRYEGRRAVL
jgi:hypothetical protein